MNRRNVLGALLSMPFLGMVSKAQSITGSEWILNKNPEFTEDGLEFNHYTGNKKLLVIFFGNRWGIMIYPLKKSDFNNDYWVADNSIEYFSPNMYDNYRKISDDFGVDVSKYSTPESPKRVVVYDSGACKNPSGLIQVEPGHKYDGTDPVIQRYDSALGKRVL